MRLKKSVGSVWRQKNGNFSSEIYYASGRIHTVDFRQEATKQTIKRINYLYVWHLDMIQQSITLEINWSILEQWTKFVNIAVL